MIKNITKEKLKNMMHSGEDFLLIDTLSRESYEEIHISGAIDIPAEEIEKWVIENFDKKDNKIVVYCGSYTCNASAMAADTIEFVNSIAKVAEEEGHHPDIAIHYNRVEIYLWTHAIKGLSENDFILAAKINRLVERPGKLADALYSIR